MIVPCRTVRCPSVTTTILQTSMYRISLVRHHYEWYLYIGALTPLITHGPWNSAHLFSQLLLVVELHWVIIRRIYIFNCNISFLFTLIYFICSCQYGWYFLFWTSPDTVLVFITTAQCLSFTIQNTFKYIVIKFFNIFITMSIRKIWKQDSCETHHH